MQLIHLERQYANIAKESIRRAMCISVKNDPKRQSTFLAKWKGLMILQKWYNGWFHWRWSSLNSRWWGDLIINSGISGERQTLPSNLLLLHTLDTVFGCMSYCFLAFHCKNDPLLFRYIGIYILNISLCVSGYLISWF